MARTDELWIPVSAWILGKENQMQDALKINWPEHYAPQNAPVHVRNT